MLWLNCSWTKHSCCIPQQGCKFITCTELLNSVEQEWFWVSALKNRVMPVLNKYLSHGTHSATWAGLMLSTIDLERRVWSCSYGILYSNCSAWRISISELHICWHSVVVYWARWQVETEEEWWFCNAFTLPVTPGVYTERSLPVSEAAFFTYLPCSQFWLHSLSCGAAQVLSWQLKKRKGNRAKETKAELKCNILLINSSFHKVFVKNRNR